MVLIDPTQDNSHRAGVSQLGTGMIRAAGVTVHGKDTRFNTEVVAGNILLLDDNVSAVVSSVVSDIELHLESPFTSIEGELTDFASFRLIKKKRLFMLKPESGLRVCWDLIAMSMLFYLVLSIPFRFGFGVEAQPGTALFYVEGAMDVLFLVDLVLNFRTGYYKRDGTVELEWKHCMKHYLKGYFLIDFVSSMPWDVIFGGMDNLENTKILKAGKVLKVSKVLKLAKLTRLLKLGHFITFLEDELNWSVTKMKLLSLLFATFGIAHMNACAWGFVSRATDTFYDDSWQFAYGMTESVSSEYTAALYWSITTMTTVGYGDITPRSDSERIFCIFSMVLTGGFYGYIIATLAAVVTSLDANQQAMMEKMECLTVYMKLRKFPRPLFRRVRGYYRHYYEKKTALDEHNILSELSPNLRREVGLFLVDSTISDVAIFSKLDADSLSKLVPMLSPFQVIPEETIVKAGELGSTMFIVMSGALQVMNKGKLVCVLTAGSYFGELCALGVSTIRTCTVEAMKMSDLYSISKVDLFAAFAGTPEVLVTMIQIAIGTYEDVKESEVGRSSSSLLGDIKEEVEDTGKNASSFKGSVSDQVPASGLDKKVQRAIQHSNDKRQLLHNELGSSYLTDTERLVERSMTKPGAPHHPIHDGNKEGDAADSELLRGTPSVEYEESMRKIVAMLEELVSREHPSSRSRDSSIVVRVSPSNARRRSSVLVENRSVDERMRNARRRSSVVDENQSFDERMRSRTNSYAFESCSTVKGRHVVAQRGTHAVVAELPKRVTLAQRSGNGSPFRLPQRRVVTSTSSSASVAPLF